MSIRRAHPGNPSRPEYRQKARGLAGRRKEAQLVRARELPGGSDTLWVGLAAATLVAAVAALFGNGVALLGLVVIGPVLTALGSTPGRTLVALAYSAALAVLLGLPTDELGSRNHLIAVGTTLAVGGLSVALARLRQEHEADSVRLGVQYDVARILADAASLEQAAARLVEAVAAPLDWAAGGLWELEATRVVRSVASWHAEGLAHGGLDKLWRRVVLEPNVGPLGRAFREGEPVWVPDVLEEDDFPRRDHVLAAGLRGTAVLPVRTPEGVVAAVELFAHDVREPDKPLVDLMSALTSQLGEFMEATRASGALREARDQLGAILSGVADAVTAQAPDGRLLFANDAAARAFGFPSPQELMDASPRSYRDNFDVLDEEGRPFPAANFPGTRALAGEGAGEAVVRFLDRVERTERWSVVKATPIVDDEGQVVMAINVLEDVTEVKRAELNQRLLADASRVLGASLDRDELLRQVAAIPVPALADWCSISIQRDDGRLELTAAATTKPETVGVLFELERRYPPGRFSEQDELEVLRTGESLLLPEVPAGLYERMSEDEEHLRLLRSTAYSGAVIAPLSARGRMFGVMALAASLPGRRFDEEDRVVVAELGRRVGTALDNARLYAERDHIARTLQTSLLPQRLPEIPGVESAARFHATGDGTEVGGDFYDVFASGPDWSVVMGDVCGKGPEAAAVTALARYTLRVAAPREPSPSRGLLLLNEELLRQRSDGRFATVAYARLAPENGEVQVGATCGGHPLPLVLRSDGRVETLGAAGTLLGMFQDPTLEDGGTRLGPGDALLFFTDGVTEAGAPERPLGEERLASLLASCAGLDADAIATRVEQAALDLQEGAPRDDIAVLVLRVIPEKG
jgi:serine phosphatase RsbU (regulator of sigma subunit)/PAS domain-containing protein